MESSPGGSCCPLTVQGTQQHLGKASLPIHRDRADGVFLHHLLPPVGPGPCICKVRGMCGIPPLSSTSTPTLGCLFEDVS